MKGFVFLLLLANCAVFAFLQIDRLGSSEADRLAQQVHPEKLKPFTHAQAKAMGLDKPLAQTPVQCLEWGPFGEAEKARALAALEQLAEGRAVSTKPVEITTAYWVFIPPLPNKAAADKKLAEIKALGVSDLYLVQESGPQRLAISLGLFRTEEAAMNYLATMQQRGVKSAKIAPRVQTLSQTQLVLREPAAGLLDKVTDLKLEFPNAEAKQTTCNDKPAA